MTRPKRYWGWWTAAVVVVGLYAALAVLIRIAPENSIDRSIADWSSGLDVASLDATMEWISWFTDLWPRLVLAFIGIIAIALSGRYRLAAVTLAVVAVTAIPINGLDLVGGMVADRIRPNGAPFLAYPSGHTLGTVIQYGFAIYLAFRLGMHRHFFIPLAVLLALPIVLVGPARILVGVHWSTDVLGAYLLGAASMIVLVLLFEIGERWIASSELLEARNPRNPTEVST